MVGRPPVVNEEVVRKLEQALQNGFTVGKACELSSISTSTYYKYCEEDSAFSDKMTRAQEFACEVARQNVVNAIVQDKDVQTSRWYLERKARAEFSTRSELAGANGEPYNIAIEVLDGSKKKTKTN